MKLQKKRKPVSFVDPKARFCTKSEKKKFAGYKAHIAKDESGIVPGAQTILGDNNEGNEANLESLLQKGDEKGLTSEAVEYDALYDSLSNRVNIEKREMKYYILENKEEEKGK